MDVALVAVAAVSEVLNFLNDADGVRVEPMTVDAAGVGGAFSLSLNIIEREKETHKRSRMRRRGCVRVDSASTNGMYWSDGGMVG